ncbi:MAG: hypothetical protein Kow00104_12170 [Rhodothalassiaceae bacterium]
MSGYEILNALLALLFVLGLIGGLALLLKRVGGIGALRIETGRRTDRRLGLVETLTLDGRHRLMLVRCDDEEHLLLLGPGAPVELGSARGGER